MSRRQEPGYIAHRQENGEPGEALILNEEREGYIRARRERHRQNMPTAENLSGLALSGGGIRSASFSLGVMQALADNQVLERIDYLSTVSGGGYIGSSLTWALHRDWEQGRWEGGQLHVDADKPKVRYGVEAENFPFGTARRDTSEDVDDSRPQARGPDKGFARMSGAGGRGAEMLRYLRQHGNYLTPGNGINILSLLGVILRGMFISLLVFVPWLILLLYPIAAHRWAGYVPGEGMPLLAEAALAIFGLFLLLAIGYALFSRFSDVIHQGCTEGTGTRWKGLFDQRFWYKMRRFHERLMPWLLTLVASLLFLGYLPNIDHWLSAGSEIPFDVQKVVLVDSGGITGLLVTLAGVLSAIGSFFKSNQKEQGKIPAGALAMVASILIATGALLLSYKAAAVITQLDALAYLLAAVAATSTLGVLANLNYLSIHRYYRDRLMESFMPNVSRVLAHAPGAAQASHMADVAALCEMQQDARAIGPYQLINTNVILVESNINKHRGRGGDSFLLSPKYCGSSATGWLPSARFAGGKLSLATAMAISGAAANPNSAPGGEGPTRQPVLSRLMTLLNLGLGVWVRNPAKAAPPWWPLPTNFLTPGSWPLVPWQKLNEEHGYLQLSDGGHFDNSGIYELIRRRVRLIIACDGGADGDFKFDDLGNLLEKVRADFGVHVEFGKGLSPLIPHHPQAGDAANPEQVAYAEEGFVCGAIHYTGVNDPSEYGLLILLKSTFVRHLPEDLLAYKKAHPQFPDQPTSDQFFDEKQFEAYRVLGFNLGSRMVSACSEELDELLPRKV